MKKRFGPIIVIVILILIGIRSSMFSVDQTQQAIIIQLGRPLDGILEPGLRFKIPFVQDAIMFERRILDYDASPAEILTEDKKNLVVDNYAKWKIVDPLKFFQTVRNVNGAQARLDDIIFAELRVELGRHLMIEIISQLRSEIMEAVTKRADEKCREFGITVVDVRIKRADLPQENERAVFGRMQAEREREAMRYRSEGQEAALKIRAGAEKERTIILAEAYRKSQEVRGQGDAHATAIYAQSFGQDPDFFSFSRSLDSYRRGIGDQTTVIMSPHDEYLRYWIKSGADPEGMQPDEPLTPEVLRKILEPDERTKDIISDLEKMPADIDVESILGEKPPGINDSPDQTDEGDNGDPPADADETSSAPNMEQPTQ
jgi:modulator of FtsH protease HflC